MFVLLNKEMGAFYKATAHRILKSFQKKIKNPTAGILHFEVGIKGCATVQPLSYVGLKIKISSPSFPKTTQMIVQHKHLPES